MTNEIEKDLFGDAPEQTAQGRQKTVPRGYAALPGTGPKEQTCGTCQHAARFNRWAKCRLIQLKWTGGRGTDILLRSPACSRWTKNET